MKNLTLRVRLMLAISLLFYSPILFSQSNSTSSITPGGLLETVYDRFGNQYGLRDLLIDTTNTTNPNSRVQLLCTNAGYFNLYFEQGCGMEGNSSIEISRRDVLCQLFNDLSAFIFPANNTVRVNLWIRDITQYVPNPGTSNVLGLATSMYIIPEPIYGLTSGIIDGEIWKTINSGQNSYSSVAAPYHINEDNLFYHGIMAFNFSNPSVNWHLNLTNSPSITDYDFYAVALHEATHALGFASLIDFNGQSKLGQFNQYYSRFDTFLETQSSVPLISNTTPSCGAYNYVFNTALNAAVLAPNPSNCSNQIKFAGTVNQATYTPSSFSAGSSLSHLEDLCHLPLPYNDNEYYVMSEANGPGPLYMKRYLKSEERAVLCDLGYKVNDEYGATLNLNYFNYGTSICNGLEVAGVNDGIDQINGTYVFRGDVGTAIPISNILSNDFNVTDFECLESVYPQGNVSPSFGNSSTLISFTVNTPGIWLLRYVPYNSTTGNRGNITYIIVYAKESGCTVSTCNSVVNNGFETGTSCGSVANMFCWEQYASSPDGLSRSCTQPDYDIPNSYWFTTSTETWNNGLNNDAFIGLWGLNSTGCTNSTDLFCSDQEAMQTELGFNLSPGNQYTFGMWAKVGDNLGLLNMPADIDVSIGPGTLATTLTYSPTAPGINVQTFLNVPADNQWHYVTSTFIFTGPSSNNNLVLAYAAYRNPANGVRYVAIDDVSITCTPVVSAPILQNPTLDIPRKLTHQFRAKVTRQS